MINWEIFWNALSAIATTSAVFISLWLSLREKKLAEITNVYVLSHLCYDNAGNEKLYPHLYIGIKNFSNIDIVINDIYIWGKGVYAQFNINGYQDEEKYSTIAPYNKKGLMLEEANYNEPDGIHSNFELKMALSNFRRYRFEISSNIGEISYSILGYRLKRKMRRI